MDTHKDEATEARLAAIETVLGVMIERLRMRDAQAILNALHATAGDAQRDPEARDHYAQALERLESLLRNGWRHQPQRQSAEAMTGSTAS
ncbi:hypothetical protein MPPM_3895 [Methylorubrum populi]|uniref:Uncharacterized protein n=1 Tax=Methylorubrum populi TaxID=223967 RepID=A0A160PKV1_9HYPH|nr:hypothetical protein [Methylorubrum populi]BAU92500.1 hypothetical protein MPPM_3895 [Methylorubrum populi]